MVSSLRGFIVTSLLLALTLGLPWALVVRPRQAAGRYVAAVTSGETEKAASYLSPGFGSEARNCRALRDQDFFLGRFAFRRSAWNEDVVVNDAKRRVSYFDDPHLLVVEVSADGFQWWVTKTWRIDRRDLSMISTDPDERNCEQ